MTVLADELQDAIGALRQFEHHLRRGLKLDADTRATLQVVLETSEELAAKVDAVPVVER